MSRSLLVWSGVHRTGTVLLYPTSAALYSYSYVFQKLLSYCFSCAFQSIVKALWLNWNAKQVVDDPRIHHQLVPETIEREEGFTEVSGFIANRHSVQ